MEIPEGGTLGDSKGSSLSVAWKGYGWMEIVKVVLFPRMCYLPKFFVFLF